MKQNFCLSKCLVVAKITFLKLFMMLLLISNAHAQTIIKGSVTDGQTNKPLEGASISIKGKTIGVTTDVNGNFSISADDKTVLVISHIGYQSMQISVGSKTIVNVALQPSSGVLKDVVVTALGITRERRSVGYSVSEVKGSTLTEARENSFVNGLEGKVAGVNVSGVATRP